MMYVICMLCIVKIYQFRHPDASPNAYSFFAFLGGIVLLEAMALYIHSWWVYGGFMLFYATMVVYIAVDCYYMGVGRLDSAIAKTLTRDLFTKWEREPESSSWFQRKGIRYPQRFAFALIFVSLNLLHAVYITVAKVMKPRKSVTHVLLLIFAGNLFLYIGYYIFRQVTKV